MPWETPAKRAARLERQRRLYPELEQAEFGEIAEIDAFARTQGESPSRFGQDSESSISRIGIPEDEQRDIEQRFGRRPPVIPEFGPPTLPEGFQQPDSPFVSSLPLGRQFEEDPSLERRLRAPFTKGFETLPGIEALEEFEPFRRDPGQPRFVERDVGVQPLLSTAQFIDELTGLPVRAAIRQGGQIITDPAQAQREQRELELEGGLGFGLEEAAPFRALGAIPGIRTDIPGTEISLFDLSTASTDILADVGLVFGAAKGVSAGARALPRATSAVRASGIRSVVPGMSDNAARTIPQVAGAMPSTRIPGQLALDQGMAIGPAARNAAEAAARRGEDIGSDVLRTLDAADVLVKQDKPGLLGELLNEIPGLKQVRGFDQPRFNIPDDIMDAYVGQGAALAEFHTKASFGDGSQIAGRIQVNQALDNAFGQGASEGDTLRQIRFLGDDDGYPAIGTVYDMFQRPDLYDLSDTQRNLIRSVDDRNLALSGLANEGYGTEIRRFVGSREGAAYLPNVDASDAARQLEEITNTPSTRSVAGIKSKSRVFDTGYDRWLSDQAKLARDEIASEQVFAPETDIRKLLTSLDSQKANAAASNVWRQGLPGRTLVEVKEDVAPRLVELRTSLRRQIDSLRGKIRRAEQSIRRDAQTARALDGQIAANDDRVGALIRQAERAEDGLPELDALRGMIDELELRQASLNEAISGPSARFSTQSARITGLRDELVEVLDEYADVRRSYEAVNLRGERFVGDGLYRYFPAEQAQQLQELTRVSGHKFFELMSTLNASVLSADLSPVVAIQGQLAFLARPVGTTLKVIGGTGNLIGDTVAKGDPFYSLRINSLAEEVAKDPEGYARFSFWLGRPVAQVNVVPDEFAGGLLGAVGERVGVPFNEANEGMYRIALGNVKGIFDDISAKAIRNGTAPDEAYAAAIDIATKTIPILNTRRLGQSAAAATAQRSPFTSISFLRQPAALMQEATMGLMKTAIHQPLTLRQQMARDIMVKMAATGATLISVAAYADAEIKGIDRSDHIGRALQQMRMHIPGSDRSIPIGGPFRGLFRAILPQPVDVAGIGEVSLPFAGVKQFFESRIAPPIKTQLELRENKDYFGNPIVTDDFPLNILQFLVHETGSFMPITGQTVVEGVREQKGLEEIAVDVGIEFLGASGARAPEFIQEAEQKDAIARSQEWTDPATGETFRVESFDELSARVGSVVADQLVLETEPGRLEELQEAQAEEAREEATGLDDPEQAFAQLDSIGQERLEWAMSIQNRIDSGKLTLGDARRLDRERNWSGELAGVFRSFAPVFERDEVPVLEEIAKLTDVNEVRDAYFTIMDQHIDPDTNRPSDTFYDDVEPRFIAAVGEEMWSRVQANIGVRDRAPWQLELRGIRQELDATGFFGLRDQAWATFEFEEATRFDSYFDWRGEQERTLRAQFSASIPRSSVDRAVEKAIDAMPISKAYNQILDGLENPWVAQNSGLADRAAIAEYFTATDPQLEVIRFNLANGLTVQTGGN